MINEIWWCPTPNEVKILTMLHGNFFVNGRGTPMRTSGIPTASCRDSLDIMRDSLGIMRDSLGISEGLPLYKKGLPWY